MIYLFNIHNKKGKEYFELVSYTRHVVREPIIWVALKNVTSTNVTSQNVTSDQTSAQNVTSHTKVTSQNVKTHTGPNYYFIILKNPPVYTVKVKSLYWFSVEFMWGFPHLHDCEYCVIYIYSLPIYHFKIYVIKGHSVHLCHYRIAGDILWLVTFCYWWFLWGNFIGEP